MKKNEWRIASVRTKDRIMLIQPKYAIYVFLYVETMRYRIMVDHH